MSLLGWVEGKVIDQRPVAALQTAQEGGMMADKKVDRSRPDRTINPTQQTTSSLSERGTINMAEPKHDKGKSALLDKFRLREERWRREQSIHDREAAVEARHKPDGAQGGPGDASKAEDAEEDGAR